MGKLREIFTGLGCASVETFIASGNVIFASDLTESALEKQIEAGLRTELGYEVTTFFRTPEELAAAVAFEPFGSGGVAAGDGLYIAFLKAGLPKKDLRKIDLLANQVDDFAVNGRDLYWLRRQMGESRIAGGVLEKALGVSTTIRNITTVRKLAAKFEAD